MTIEEKKEAVRQAIVRAVPSVMDLDFGCRVKVSWDAWGEPSEGSGEYCEAGYDIGYVTFDDMLQFNGSNSLSDIFAATLKDGYDEDYEYTFEIIGRPITLQDIIYALKKNEPKMFGAATVSNQMKMQAPLETKIKNIVNAYDLLQDFDHQSEAVWDFLWELLVNNK